MCSGLDNEASGHQKVHHEWLVDILKVGEVNLQIGSED
jgi:hypothetical protein